MKNLEYEALARVYDDLMYDVSAHEWAAYLHELMGMGGQESGRILEYACGTGNLTLELIRYGYTVTAVDRSVEMLDMAAAKLRKHAASANLVCADMTEFRLNGQADAAVCACDGVNYIRESETLRQFFETVFHNLRPRGVFLFDLSSEYKLSGILGNEFYYDDGEDQTLFWQNEYDPDKREVTMNITLFIRERGVYQRFDECHIQKAWKEDEVLRQLLSAGFERVESYAFGTRTAARKDSERIQFLAVKGERE